MRTYIKALVFLGVWLGITAVFSMPALAQTVPAYDPTDTTNGTNIITAVFTSINKILNTISQNFYTGILGGTNSPFKQVVNAVILLYIVVYGTMITFNLASYRGSEIVSRIIKIGILAAVVNGGWSFFEAAVGNPVLHGMNQLIVDFASASGNTQIANLPTTSPCFVTTGTDTASSNCLDVNTMTALFAPLSGVFCKQFILAILALLTSGPVGWIVAFFMTWGMFEFIFMVIGAIITYVKSIVGLAFLFGIAPIFFLFILFDKTRQLFIGWVNQVLGFALQPVLLFAFLGFYLSLISAGVKGMLGGLTFCQTALFQFLGVNIQVWRAQVNGNCYTGDWVVPGGGLMILPISMISVLYFLLLCHLGKSFSKYIEQISRDLSSGQGPGVTTGGDVGAWFRANLAGGRGPAQVMTDSIKAAGLKVAQMKAGAARDTSVSRPAATTGAADRTQTAKTPTYMGEKKQLLADAAKFRVNKQRAAINAATAPARAAVAQGVERAAAPVLDAADRAKERVGVLRDAATGAAVELGSRVSGTANNVWGTLGDAHSKAMETGRDALETGRDAFNKTTDPFVKGAQAFSDQVGESKRIAGEALKTRVVDPMLTTANNLQTKATDIQDGLNKTKEQILDEAQARINAGVDTAKQKTDKGVSRLAAKIAGDDDWDK